ncbi:glycosyltransferase family 4 protein [Leptolyngbya sp. PCC 6406]|uniref:glycosyltransferase family 4 protein n=1 Tax=Leptolyngbya sp. PCC 6406 TaxID=1173264 RepID=UPI0002AC1C69|nr:glycosyltransferase family 4 protein [Leptolyngbya sp. PCC 6406]
MKLLYTLTSYVPAIGGAQVHTHLLAQHLAIRNTVQTVCHWDHNRTDWLWGTTIGQPSSYNYQVNSIPVHRLGFTWAEKLRILPWLPLYYPLMSLALPPVVKLIARHLQPFIHKADVLHNVRIGREGISVASWKVAQQHNLPFILTPVHHPRWVGWRYRAYLELYRQADAVIALTASEKATLIMLGVEPEHIYVTGIGPVLAAKGQGKTFRDIYNIQEPIVLFLGQHYSYKGFRQVLEAAPSVWKQLPDVQFVFIGPAVKRSEQVFDAYADPRIHRLGSVDLQTKTNALAACDLLCVPSSQESFGGVYTEAWSFGKPVIGGRIPAIADVVTDGQDGFLVNQDPEEIACRILDLLTQPAAAAAMGLAGKRKVEAHYTWPKLAEKTLGVYRSVLGGRKGV